MADGCGCGHGDGGGGEGLRSRIEAALASVEDPDFGDDALSSGLVAGVECRDGEVRVELETAGLPAPAAETVEAEVREAVLSVPGVDAATVADAGGMAEAGADVSLPGVESVVAVASAKGGVGKTTVAVALARALADRGASVGLFDADLHGPNVPDRLGVSGPVTATDDGRAAPVDADGVATMSVGLLAGDDPLAWRGAMAHEALTDLLADTAWGDLDYLVVDLPPGTGDVVLTALQSVPLAGVLLVTTPDPSAVGDAVRSEALFREEGVPVLGAVTNMTAATCPECGTEHAVFRGADAGEAFRSPVLAEFPVDDALRDPATAGDRAADLAATVADAVDGDDDPLPPDTLDLRGVPARAVGEQLAVEAGALDAGESLTAVLDTPPDEHLAAAGLDDPATVERRGPEEWRVDLRAPNAAAAGGREVSGRGTE